MSVSMMSEINDAWRDYKRELKNLTELQEAQVEKAFRSGWRCGVEASSTHAKPTKPATEA